jgi:hypothetical protein
MAISHEENDLPPVPGARVAVEIGRHETIL